VRTSWLKSLSQLPQLVSYCGASTVALGADAGLLLLLTRVCRWPYLLAAAVSFVSGGIIVYYIWLRALFIRGPAFRPTELAVFVLLGSVGLAVNMLVIAVAVELAHAPLIAAKAAAAVCTFFSNYTLRRRLILGRGFTAALVARESQS
jgi:putative flippase GtrA